jgi:hypothetical protein
MKKLIRECDTFGQKVELFVNGESKFKSLFGGMLWILTLLMIGAASGYFLSKFFNRDESTTITNTVFSNDVNYDLHKIPIMMRLSNSLLQVRPDWEKIWNVKLKIWHGGVNETDPLKRLTQYPTDFDLETCDLNKHFGEWAYLFRNISDLDTYICPNMRNQSEPIYGVYGDVRKPFSYYNFYFHRCAENCIDSKVMNSYLSNTFMDMRTVDFSTDSNSIVPNSAFVRAERFAVSHTVWRRIWLYAQKVMFTSDFGYVFEDKSSEVYFQHGISRSDVDMRDKKLEQVPNTFLMLTILNNPSQLHFSRSYLKAQQFLANV